MSRQRIEDLLRIARMAIDAASRECEWTWSQNLKRIEEQAAEIQHALTARAGAGEGQPSQAAHAVQANGQRPNQRRDGSSAGGSVRALEHDALDGGAGAHRVRAPRAWDDRPGSVRDLIGRLSEMPDFTVRVDVHGVVGCPRCNAAWDAADLNLDYMVIQSASDIDHMVGRDGTEWVEITATP